MSKKLVVGIQGKGSATVDDMRILSGLLSEQNGYRLETISEDDSLLRLYWLKRGKIDFLYESANTPFMFEGRAPALISRDRGPFPMRMVASAHSGAFGFIVRADSRIKTIYDITPETRIADTRASHFAVYGLLAWLKMYKGRIPVTNPETARWDATLVPIETWESNLNSVKDGIADVAYVSPENPIVKQIAKQKPGIRFLELPAQSDPDGYKRFLKLVPGTMIVPAPESGTPEVWGKYTVTGTANLWCRPDFDTRVAYRLTRWFDEKYDQFKDLGNKLKTYSLEALRQNLDRALAPVHQGTVEYLKEKGFWTAADERRQTYNLWLMDRYCQAWEQALALADDMGIEVKPENPEWVTFWSDYKALIRMPSYKFMDDKEISRALKLLPRKINI